MDKISIIIPTYQRCCSLKRTLTALSNQTFSFDDFEVIVSVDGSFDGTEEMLLEFRSPYALRYVVAKNSGRAKACNRGILEAAGEILIIIDDDMEPSPYFVEAHFISHSKNNKLGVIGSAQIIIDESSNFATKFIAKEFNNRQKFKMSDPNYTFQLWDFYGGNFSIRRDVLNGVGLFNESFKIYGYEDIELAYRLVCNNVRIIYNSEALCLLHQSEEFEILAKKTINSGRSAVLLVNLHPQTFNQLKFRDYNSPGWKWRLFRKLLLKLSMNIPVLTQLYVILIKKCEGVRISILEKMYSFSLDYLFWLGVWSELARLKSKKLEKKIKSTRNKSL